MPGGYDEGHLTAKKLAQKIEVDPGNKACGGSFRLGKRARPPQKDGGKRQWVAHGRRTLGHGLPNSLRNAYFPCVFEASTLRQRRGMINTFALATFFLGSGGFVTVRSLIAAAAWQISCFSVGGGARFQNGTTRRAKKRTSVPCRAGSNKVPRRGMKLN